MGGEFRNIPSVEEAMSHERLRRLAREYTRAAALTLAREAIDGERERIRAGGQASSLDDLTADVERRAAMEWGRASTRVINATGVILHTNLGRAPLSADAIEAYAAASAYGDLEFDLRTGRRGSRQSGVSSLLRQLTGAESGYVVNNNAAAALLCLASVGSGREVIVSRGEAVEIGGGFRIPDVLRQSGAALVEVGTTNKTYVSDYEAALTERTGGILTVHASNFSVVGFTHAPTLRELADLAARAGVPLLHDLGSGCLLDTSAYGLAPEPMAQASVRDGASLSFFSGDKLLGGPQAGIIIGKRPLIAAVSRHPLARTMRMDKGSMAALRATLLHYLKGESEQKIPVWNMIAQKTDTLSARAEAWRSEIGGTTSVVDGESTIGGGSLPGQTLPTRLLAIDAASLPGGANALAARLRQGAPPIVARIVDERVLLDPRTMPRDVDAAVAAGVRRALAQL